MKSSEYKKQLLVDSLKASFSVLNVVDCKGIICYGCPLKNKKTNRCVSELIKEQLIELGENVPEVRG